MQNTKNYAMLNLSHWKWIVKSDSLNYEAQKFHGHLEIPNISIQSVHCRNSKSGMIVHYFKHYRFSQT